MCGKALQHSEASVGVDSSVVDGDFPQPGLTSAPPSLSSVTLCEASTLLVILGYSGPIAGLSGTCSRFPASETPSTVSPIASFGSTLGPHVSLEMGSPKGWVLPISSLEETHVQGSDLVQAQREEAEVSSGSRRTKRYELSQAGVYQVELLLSSSRRLWCLRRGLF
jgi:hypothetical protein